MCSVLDGGVGSFSVRFCFDGENSIVWLGELSCEREGIIDWEVYNRIIVF